MNETTTNQPFAPTRWTLVLRARGETPEARAALSELCAAYYQPVLRFLLREGRTEEEARELAQEFFAAVLQGGMGSADPARGRFRSYLLGAVKHFLADCRKLARRQKRGSGVIIESLDAADGELPVEIPDATGNVTDAWFDRAWALAVMERALNSTEAEFRASDKLDQFHLLQPWLVGDAATLSQAEVARQLGLDRKSVV